MVPDDLDELVDLCRTRPIVDVLAAVEQRYRGRLDGLDVWLWDHQHSVLQALRDQQTTVRREDRDRPPDGAVAVDLEVLGDELGVVTARPADPDRRPDTERLLVAIAPVLALAVRVNEPTVDTIPVRRRRREMALAAEMQWAVLPPTALHTGSVRVSAAVEPAYETGGDLFDFALHDGRLSLCVLDAMGHGLRAAQVSTLAVGALRRARRNGAALADTAKEVGAAVAAAGMGAYVSAVMAELDLGSGRGRWLSAGHLPPLVTDRSGHPRELDLVPTLPLGMEIAGRTAEPTVRDLELRPGEALVLYSDGIVENAAVEDHQPIGEARFHDALTRVLGAAPDGSDGRACARDVIEDLLTMTGPVLRDDATLLVARRPE